MKKSSIVIALVIAGVIGYVVYKNATIALPAYEETKTEGPSEVEEI